DRVVAERALQTPLPRSADVKMACMCNERLNRRIGETAASEMRVVERQRQARNAANQLQSLGRRRSDRADMRLNRKRQADAPRLLASPSELIAGSTPRIGKRFCFEMHARQGRYMRTAADGGKFQGLLEELARLS